MKAINAAPIPSSTTLAPTDHPASCLISRLRVMPIGRHEWRSYRGGFHGEVFRDVAWEAASHP